MKVSIRDNAFGHSPISNSPTPPIFAGPSPIAWDRESPATLETVYTDNLIFQAPRGAKAWMIEPAFANNLPLHEHILRNGSMYSEIWTADREHLKANPNNAFFIGNFGCWIEPQWRKVWAKTKACSIIASNKHGGHGYDLRHAVIHAHPYIHAYGPEYAKLPDMNLGQGHKIHGMMEYRFHVCIENCRRDYFFSEKLIDCFMTGCIPIYWGCPSIHEFFDTRGMMCFEDIDDLDEIFEWATPEYYSSRLKYIAENFERAKGYVLAEDKIYQHLRK